MRWITELKDRHENQPIWIAGSDASLDGYPDDLFENKIGITLHLAHIKFPHATYRFANELDRVKFLKNRDPDYFEKENIFAFPFFNKSCEITTEITKDAKSAYYFRLKAHQPLEVIPDLIREAKEATSVEFGGYGTCLHACLFTAIMMGGNPINIIGCNHERIGDRLHFSQADLIDEKMRPGCKNFIQGQEKVKEWTQALIDGCSKQGITIHWFKSYYKMKTFEVLAEIKTVLDNLEIPFVLHCGTLLGAYRNKDFLPGDENDLDLLIMEKDQSRISEIISRLSGADFSGPSYFKIKGRTECFGMKKGKVHFDIGVLHIKGEEAFSLGKTGARIYPAHCFREFDKLIFNGMEFSIPHKPEDFLEARYGKNWRTPISNKDWYAGEYKKNMPNLKPIDEVI